MPDRQLQKSQNRQLQSETTCNYKRLEYVTTNDNVGDDKRTQAVTEAPTIPRASLFFRKVSTTLLRNNFALFGPKVHLLDGKGKVRKKR